MQQSQSDEEKRIDLQKFSKVEIKEFHKKQKERLSAEGFKGHSLFMELFCEHLKKFLKRKWVVKQPADAVLAAFKSAAPSELPDVFYALKTAAADAAAKQQGQLSELDRRWLVELMCYTTLLGLDWDFWHQQPGGQLQGNPQAKDAVFIDLPTTCALVSAVGMAGVMGCEIRFGTEAGMPRNLGDVVVHLDFLSTANKQRDQNEQGKNHPLVKALYDRLFAYDPDKNRENKDQPLTGSQVGDVRQWFRDRRRGGRLCGIFVVLPSTFQENHRQLFGAALAEMLNGLVMVGSTVESNGLVLGETTMTPGEFDSCMADIFRMLGLFKTGR